MYTNRAECSYMYITEKSPLQTNLKRKSKQLYHAQSTYIAYVYEYSYCYTLVIMMWSSYVLAVVQTNIFAV